MAKKWLTCFAYVVCAVVLLNAPSASYAEPASPPPLEGVAPTLGGGGEADVPRDELTPEQEAAMWAEIQRNMEALRQAGVLAAPSTAQAVTYDFPLRLAPGLPDSAGFRVSAFVDHNPTTGQVLDYNGGTRTYDGHRGTDYALFPFNWNKVNASDMQVIAAAAGIIVYKGDTDPTDHNPCDGGSNNDQWNYVALAHADGRMTIYGHMRYHSLTSKTIGQTVAQGEYLGLVASSGNSSGPHLHFEARVDSTPSGAWIDPYAGPNSQAESLWTAQRPYYDSAINRLATHATPPDSPSCQPAIPNLQDSFTTPATIYFYAYYRDFQGALPTHFTIYRPDNSVLQVWDYSPATTFSSVWSYGQTFAFSSADPAGTWRFEAIYNGQTHQTFFNVNAPTTITVTSPNSGELWSRLLPHTLTWNDNLGGGVNIALYHNGVYTAPIAFNVPSTGQYVWIPNPTQAALSGYTISVTSVISPLVYDGSDSPFTLLAAIPPPVLSLSQTVTPLSPQPNQTVTYTVIISNSGLGDATGGQLTNLLPTSLTPSGTITLTNLTVGARQTLSLTFPAQVNSGQTAGLLLTNTVTFTCTQVITPLMASSTITIADAPLRAQDDFRLTPVNTPITISVLSNDGDPNGDALALAAVGTPFSGTASLLGANVIYTPTLDMLGSDIFTYTITTTAESTTATVKVLIASAVWELFMPLIQR